MNINEIDASNLFSKLKKLLEEERWKGYNNCKAHFDERDGIIKSFSVPLDYEDGSILVTFRYNLQHTPELNEPRLTVFYELDDKINSSEELNDKLIDWEIDFSPESDFENLYGRELYNSIRFLDCVELFFLKTFNIYDLEVDSKLFSSSKSYRSDEEIEAEIDWLKSEFERKYYKINYSKYIQEITFPDHGTVHFLKIVDMSDQLFRIFLDSDCWYSNGLITVFGYLLKEDQWYSDEVITYKFNLYFDEQEEQLFVNSWVVDKDFDKDFDDCYN